MESDVGGTESDVSDWDPAYAGLTSENSEDSDEYGIYYGDSLNDASVEYQNHRQVISGYALQGRPSQGDNAYSGSGSLYPIHEHGPGMGEGTADDDDIEEADCIVSSDSPVYGRYQKLGGSGHSSSHDAYENVMLHRLPGENLGMILGIEDGKNGKVSCVAVKSVTLGGAAYRATGSSKGVCTGDEIVAVNGMDLRQLTNDECKQVFKDMPLRVMLGIRRGQKDLPPVSISPATMLDNQHKGQKGPNIYKSVRTKPVHITRKPDLSDSEDDGFGGFAVYQVLVEKDPDENLGISIVPSYGSTREYYQVKRILPSGAAAHSGNLEVGDRLITCNGTRLKGLTQNHCLDIIKTASAYGDIQFEVIRPVYHGNSMQISVTVNRGVNNANSRTKNISSSFDPSQYSLKSQSYDRQGIDVIVTSESEDYLTVSEDEYSRSGRLANISEVEANEVFVANSVRLAFQKDINTIEEESSETDLEERLCNISKKQKCESDVRTPLDLSAYTIQPIPRKRGQFAQNYVDQGPSPIEIDSNTAIPKSLSSPLPKSDLDLVSPRSPLPKSDLVSPRSPLPKSDIDLVSPRSPLKNSNLDQVSPRSPVPKSDLNIVSSKPSERRPDSGLATIKSTTLSSNLDKHSLKPPLPWSDVDQLSPRSSVHSHHLDAEISDLDDSYLKRQQVPSDTELSDLELPYNYPAAYIGQSIPVSDTEETRYNPLYEDSNLSEFTDSEPQDVYIPSPAHKRSTGFSDKDLDRLSVESDQTLTRTEIDTVSVDSRHKVNTFEQNSEAEELSLPPPLEFSDTNFVEPEDPEYTFLEEFTKKNRGQKVYQHLDQETDFEFHGNIPEIPGYEEEIDSAKLAFSSELTAPFDIVLQEQGVIVNSSPASVDAFNEDVYLQVENEPVYENIKSVDRSGYFISRFAPSQDSKMDNNSESVLKNALDIEYDNLSESKKQQGRIELIENNNVVDYEDPMYVDHNIVAENIAMDIVREENRVGYFVESDNEPDAFPEQDLPEEIPELPSCPPPCLNNDASVESSNVVVISVNGMNPEETDEETLVTQDQQQKQENALEDVNDSENDVIVPTKIERKVEIPINITPQNKNIDDQDNIIPEAVQRTFQLPTEFKENTLPLEDNDDFDNLDNWVTVTSALSPEPEPRKLVTSLDIQNNESEGEEVEEEIIQPVNAMKDHSKDLVNIINVVNALKKAAKDKDPDIVDKIEKDERQEKPKGFASAVIKLNKQSADNEMNAHEVSPPREEQVISNRVAITVKHGDTKETPPPKSETFETEREVLNKPDPVPKATHGDGSLNYTNVLKTSITVEKPKVDDIMQKPKSETTTLSGLREQLSVPPLNLEALNGNSSDIGSPSSDRSEEISPSSKYKTTIGVPKPPKSPVLAKAVEKSAADAEITVNNINDQNQETSIPAKDKPSLAPIPSIKPLSQIKPLSFNPKSLSQIGSRPVQYKTTISTLGMKPSSFAKTMPGSQKPDYPIKRMETMPFEVSILKGILGIGIKTTMTPEGHVKVTEILPNGPVGREGNIKVGDYILSINSTELTGLTDAKVQQILRLLPRGLSKIVASAVSPNGQQDSPEVLHEKSPLTAVHSLPLTTTTKTSLSPRQESPTLSPRQPTTAAAVSAQPLSPNRPTPVPRVNTAAPSLPKSQPPVAAPRSLTISTSPRSPLISPVSPKQHPTISQKPTKSSAGSPSVSPLPSPRKSDVTPPTSSQLPPPIAPKPKRPSSTQSKAEIETAPIDAEVFVSVCASNEKSPRSGANILPGSVNYDYVHTVEKTGWVPGVVSSASLQQGKEDVVTDAPDNSIEHAPVTDNMDVVYTVLNADGTEMPSEGTSSKIETAPDETNETAPEDPHVDNALYTNRSRSFSTSSNGSYQEFKECDVEDDIVPEQIAEENVVHNDQEEVYEPDFEEEEDSKETDKETEELKIMAEQIVANVISSVKASDLLSENLTKEDNVEQHEQLESMHENTELENAEELAVEEQMVETTANDVEAPPLPQSPPPLPTIDIPELNTEPEKELVDLSLYPDSDQGSEENLKKTHEDNETDKDRETLDVVDSQTSALLHVESPCVKATDVLEQSENVINDLMSECDDDNGANNSPSQIISTSGDQEDDVEEMGDQSISNVISMYSSLEQSLAQDDELDVKTENNNNDYKVHLDEQVVYDSLGNDNIEDNSKTISRDNITDSVQNENIMVLSENTGISHDKPILEEQEKSVDQNKDMADINGCSGSFINESVELDSVASKDSVDEKVQDDTDASDTPRSLSRVDQLLSEHENTETKYSPELDRMIRMMSSKDEPEFEGEGELLTVTLNKGVTGLGFLIQGGRFTPRGDMPLTIKRVFKGGPADGILQAHDEICEINGEDTSDMRHTEAWNHLKFLSSGDLTLTIRRYTVTDASDV